MVSAFVEEFVMRMGKRIDRLSQKDIDIYAYALDSSETVESSALNQYRIKSLNTTYSSA